MAVSLTGSVKLIASLSDVRTLVTGAAAEVGRREHSFDAAWSVLSGVAANLGDRIWSDSYSILTGATYSLDLATPGGTLLDAFGAPVVFAKVRAVLLSADPTNSTLVTLARPAANGVPLFGAASGAMAPLSAGGLQLWCDPGVGVVVTVATADLISVINSAGGTATGKIMLIGTSS